MKKTRKSNKVRERCSGTMTEAEFTSFVDKSLRAAFTKWGPKFEAIKLSRRGDKHECAGCSCLKPYQERDGFGGKKINNFHVDHIYPVSPLTGLNDWNTKVEGMFVEVEDFQVLCLECHAEKTKMENELRRKFKKSLDYDPGLTYYVYIDNGKPELKTKVK